MDPLSVLASIVGLLAVSGKVSKGLGGVISSLKDAPNSVHIVLTEVNGFHAVISSIHKFVQSNVLVSSRRAALIDVDQLIVTLTESVLTFSEFDTVVTSLKAASTTQYGLRNRMRYAWKEDKIARLIGRVQQHKASLALILNIIQWYDVFLMYLLLMAANPRITPASQMWTLLGPKMSSAV